jgi:hypothetical protein
MTILLSCAVCGCEIEPEVSLYLGACGPLCAACFSLAEEPPRRQAVRCVGGPLDGVSVCVAIRQGAGFFAVAGGHYIIQDVAHVGLRFCFVKGHNE